MTPGNSAYNDDWTDPDPWIGQEQGTMIVHGPGLARER